METLPEDIEFTTEEVEEYKAEFAKVRFSVSDRLPVLI